MSKNTIIVTGSGGLVGSENVRHFSSIGYNIVGIDNDMRKFFLGESASTNNNTQKLIKEIKNFKHLDVDLRRREVVIDIIREHSNDLAGVIHCAAQPSHDLPAKKDMVYEDFEVNALATLNLLESCRKYAKDTPFIFTSTNKVYGDTPNFLPLVENETRYEIREDHPYFSGIDESMSIDQCKHSVFGASKAAADLMVQEYGKYFDMPTVVFRGGCLTGPAHASAELHGFLSYLVKCIVSGRQYNIFGYKGKQVRDNIHSNDIASAFECFIKDPKKAGEVYNLGGGRMSNCSMMEAISYIEGQTGKKANTVYVDENRAGDHIWWISNMAKFRKDYPNWNQKYTVEMILDEIISVEKENFRG